MLKAAASVIVLCMLSTILPSPAGDEISARASAANGSYFTAPVMINSNKANDQAAPVSIIATGHELFVVWQDARSGDEDIYTSLSLDQGITFTTNRRADDATVVSKQIEPATSVSGNGTIYVAWQDNRRALFDYDIYFTRSYDGGLKFAKNTKVDDSNGTLSWQERPAVASTAGGAICVAWTDDRTGQLRVRYAYSANGGDTFSASKEIVPLGNTGGQTGVALASSGNRIFAAFLDNVSGRPHPYVSVSSDGGKTFSSPERIDDTGDSSALQNCLSLAPLPNGGMVILWEDSRNSDWDIYGSIFSADGDAIRSNMRVDDDTTHSYQRGVCVATDQLGNIYAVWEDDRDLKYAIRFAYYETNNSRFSASLEVSSPGPMDIQRRPSVVAPSPGRVAVIWQDDKSGTYDVYSSTAYFPSLFAVSLVKGWNFVSIPTIGFTYSASTLGLMRGDIVAGWNPATQTYDKNYVVGLSPPLKDFIISDSTGYLIFAQAAERILLNGTIPTVSQQRQISVPEGGGWFVAGFESLDTPMFASEMCSMYSGANVRQVNAYNSATGTYKMYVPMFPFTDFLITPGQAYWVSVSGSGTFAYDP